MKTQKKTPVTGGRNARWHWNRVIAVSACALTTSVAYADIKDILGSLTNMGAPRVEIPIAHAPSLSVKVSVVALGPPEGKCSDPLASRIEEDFVNSGVQVIDRSHLTSVLAEHKLQVSGFVDEKTAAKVGQLLGAQALIFLKLAECGAGRGQNQEPVLVNNRAVVDYYTEGQVSGSMRIIDLTSGRVLAAQHVEGKATLSSQSGYPSDQEAVDQAEKVAAESVHRMFFAWTETKSVIFYKDSQCGLNTALNLLRSKDLDGALQKAQANLDDCRTNTKSNAKPSLVAHAYYDVGILQFLKSDYDSALTNLNQASQLDSDKVILNALADTRTAKASAALLAQHQDEAPSPASTKSDLRQAQTNPTKAGTPEERLRRLDDLLKKKLITKEEYSQQRSKILSEM